MPRGINGENRLWIVAGKNQEFLYQAIMNTTASPLEDAGSYDQTPAVAGGDKLRNEGPFLVGLQFCPHLIEPVVGCDYFVRGRVDNGDGWLIGRV